MSYKSSAVPMVVVQQSSNQSAGNQTSTDLLWQVETRDDLGISAVGAGANTKVCTFATAGVWLAEAYCATDVVGGARFAQLSVQLFDSNNTNIWNQANGGQWGSASLYGTYITVASTFRVSPGDYVKVNFYQDSGGSVNIGGAGYARCSLTHQGT